MQTIDTFIQRTTMYKVVLWSLLALAGIAIIFGFSGAVSQSGLSLLASAAILTQVCWFTNVLLAKLFRANPNPESAVITALILFFIFSAPSTPVEALRLAMVGVIAMASKYVVAYRARHIFNPAAFAAVVAGFAGLGYASWWVATAAMTPFVLVAGFIILRKIRRTPMFLVFYTVAFTLVVLLAVIDGIAPSTALNTAFISWPLLFMGMIMLTEPLTTPPTRSLRVIYAVLVAILTASALKVGGVFISPEIALILGNIYAYSTTLRQRVQLRLVRKTELAPNIFEFSFKPEKTFAYQAGQYLETALPVPKPDVRGSRRTFTIASSPTENDVKLGIKFAQPSSTFKQELQQLPESGFLYGVQMAGDFTLPNEPASKLLMIAGGIGITPFRSHLKWLVDTKQQRDIVLLYSVASAEQIVYRDILEQAKQHGVKVVFVLGNADAKPADWQGETGFIDAAMLERVVPDYPQRIAYISGPPPMVTATKQLLRQHGVKHIKTDYFSGY